MNLSVLELLPLVAVAAGTNVIEQGQPVRGIFFLESGEVEVLKDGVLIAETYEPGAMLGEMSWLLDTTPMATVRTLVACRFRHAVEPGAFVQQHPEVALHVAVTLARRVDSLSRYLVDIKNQFRDRADHLGMIDQVLDSLIHKHPRHIPRRATGD
jgi:CRP/FNR family cyclic AMP-dependent transcriptional regulator